MARDTRKDLRGQVMYSVFVRNYSEEGTFDAVRRDLGRIRDLGVDVIWLLPIHPIGIEGRKGTVGSPYAIMDYRRVDPAYGTVEDLKRLAADAHDLGMRLIIDVVYNHTSPDSWLAKHHPEWFYHGPDGRMGNRFGDWADVVDLDYSHPGLWDYQIDTLKMWAEIVDGFRCDVAALVPLDFWLRARREVAKVRPDALWLAESVEPGFIAAARENGLNALSDSEIFQAFDIAYDYDIFPCLRDVWTGQAGLGDWLNRLNAQEYIYPDNYVKLRFLENHDVARAAFSIPDRRALMSWTAFLYFQKGMTLLYAGQERGLEHLPALFEKDPVDWTAGEDMSEWLRALHRIKRDPLLSDSAFATRLYGNAVLAEHRKNGRRIVGAFPLDGRPALIPVNAPEGWYRDRIAGRPVEVHRGRVSLDGSPVIFEV